MTLEELNRSRVIHERLDRAYDMIETLRQPEVLREMPDEVLLEILNSVPDGALPDDIMKSLEKEALRRGFFKG